MGTKFNPLIFAGLDFTGSGGGNPTIGNPVNDADPNSVLIVDAAGNLGDVPLADGELVIGSSSGEPTAGTITGTTNQVNVTNGANTITLSLPQSIATTSSPQFANVVLSPSGSVDITNAGGTLAIGTANADIINIGNSGATVNVQGTTFYQNVTDLVVTDKTITINSGGSAGSASNAGIEVEENSLITGYVEVSADRNSWQAKAPNTAGIATITPGSGGITLNQSSHNPVTIGTANGLSLATQQISLDLSSTSTTGALSDTDWNTFNDKQDAGNYITALTGDITASGPGSSTATLATVNSDVGSFTRANITVNAKGLITAAANGSTAFADNTFRIQDNSDNTKQLAFEASGIATATTRTVTIPDANVDLGNLTDSNISPTAAIQHNKMEALVGDKAVITNNLGFVTTSTVTSTEVSYLAGASSSIQNQLNAKLAKAPGDIDSTTWSGLVNNTADQTIVGLTFANTVLSFDCFMNVFIDATIPTYTTISVTGTRQNASNWSTNDCQVEFSGTPITGLAFSINSAGQVLITIGNISGFTSGTVKFRAISIS